jgi:putative ABC transport system permease protein
MIGFEELIASLEIGLIYGIVAAGIYLTFRVINFPDLTCDGSFPFGAAVSAVMIQAGYDPYISVIFALVAGGLAGFLTGILNVYLKIEDLLAGIIVAFMLYSVNLRVMGSSPNITFVDANTIFTDGNVTLKIGLIVLFVAALLSYILITDFGLGLRSIGQNRQFASSCGINVKATTIIGLTLSNAMIGMCGSIFAQHQCFCDISQGVGCLVMGLASVIIGEKILRLGNIVYSIAACVVGSVIYRIFIAFAIHSDFFGFKTQDLNLVTGLMIIVVMASRKNKCCV